ncbi:Malate dehydrogenase, partial [Operophtera brumata]
GAGGPANLGHCFVAVDPESFAPGFGDHLADSMAHWRQLEPSFAPGFGDHLADSMAQWRQLEPVRAEVPSST